MNEVGKTGRYVSCWLPKGGQVGGKPVLDKAGKLKTQFSAQEIPQDKCEGLAAKKTAVPIYLSPAEEKAVAKKEVAQKRAAFAKAKERDAAEYKAALAKENAAFDKMKRTLVEQPNPSVPHETDRANSTSLADDKEWTSIINRKMQSDVFTDNEQLAAIHVAKAPADVAKLHFTSSGAVVYALKPDSDPKMLKLKQTAATAGRFIAKRTGLPVVAVSVTGTVVEGKVQSLKITLVLRHQDGTKERMALNDLEAHDGAKRDATAMIKEAIESSM